MKYVLEHSGNGGKTWSKTEDKYLTSWGIAMKNLLMESSRQSSNGTPTQVTINTETPTIYRLKVVTEGLDQYTAEELLAIIYWYVDNPIFDWKTVRGMGHQAYEELHKRIKEWE